MAARKLTPKPIATDSTIVAEIKEQAAVEVSLHSTQDHIRRLEADLTQAKKNEAAYLEKLNGINGRIVQHITSRWEAS